MTINSYLHEKSQALLLNDDEKISISTSIITLRTRLSSYFPGELSETFIFGSYDRGTILPRSYDINSDVDFMIVFSDGGYQPQTYLDKLRRFATNYYSSSDIAQSHPTIKIDMNHIRFELVPALLSYGQYQIPSRASGYQNWTYTDPRGFKARLQECNKKNKWYIAPTVRLMKHWNVAHGRTFDSYELEQLIVEYFQNKYFVEGCNYWSYFRQFVENLVIAWDDTQSRRDKITALKNSVETIKRYISEGRSTDANNAIERLLP